jgi:glutaredoxin
MKKPFILILLGTFAVIILGAIFLGRDSNSSSPPLPASYEYFWGKGCPHCENVEKFLETWDKKDKIKIDKKEVFNDKNNALSLIKIAASCNLAQDEIGVPFLFTPEGKCISGDQPIIEFFKNLK